MSKIRQTDEALTKIYGLVILAGGIVILILWPFALIYGLVTASGTGFLKILGAAAVLLVAGILGIRIGSHMIRTGYEPYDANRPK